MKKLIIKIAAGALAASVLLGSVGCGNEPVETTNAVETTSAATTSATQTTAQTTTETTASVEITTAQTTEHSTTTEEVTTAETTTEVSRVDFSNVEEQYTDITLHFTKSELCASAYNASAAEGTVFTQSGYFSTDLVDISGFYGLSYELAAYRTAMSIAFYDENGAYLDGVGTPADTNAAIVNGAVIIPENAKYAKFLAFAGTSRCEAFTGSYVRGFANADDYAVTVGKRACYGMQIACIGDGITEGDYSGKNKTTLSIHSRGYAYFMQETLGAEVINYGKKDATAASVLQAYKDGVIDIKNADVIMIMLGTNKGLEGDMGIAYNELLSLIEKDKKADAKIVLLTPPHATSDNKKVGKGNAATVEKAAAVVRNTASAKGYALIDVLTDAPFCTEMENVYQPHDGLHLAETGHRVMAKFLAEKLAALELIPEWAISSEEETDYEDLRLEFVQYKMPASKHHATAAEGELVGRAGYFCTDYIDVSEYYGLAYELAAYKTIYSVAFFDENQKFISGIGANSLDQTFADTVCGTVIVPENAKYAKFITFAGDSTYEAYDRGYVHGYLDEASYNAYAETKPYSGLSIACLGDSLTEGDYGGVTSGTMNIHTRSWTYFLQRELGCEVENFGKCGWTASSLLSSYKKGEIDISESDFIVVWIGSNGGLGGDNGNAYQTLLKQINADKKEGAKVILAVPPHHTEDERKSGNGGNANTIAVRTAVMDTLKSGDYIFADLYAETPIQSEMENFYQPHDGVHLSEAGYRVAADYILEIICEAVK